MRKYRGVEREKEEPKKKKIIIKKKIFIYI